MYGYLQKTPNTMRGTQMNPHIRWMIRRDMAKVLEIEHLCFSEPWSEEEFLIQMRQKNTIGMVAEHEDQVVGYMVYNLHKDKLELTNLATQPLLQRRGIGTALIKKLQSKLNPERRTAITAEVRETNLGAQLFLRNMGFKAIEIIRTPYHCNSEDAYLMQHSIPSVHEEAFSQETNWLDKLGH